LKYYIARNYILDIKRIYALRRDNFLKLRWLKMFKHSKKINELLSEIKTTCELLSADKKTSEILHELKKTSETLYEFKEMLLQITDSLKGVEENIKTLTSARNQKNINDVILSQIIGGSKAQVLGKKIPLSNKSETKPENTQDNLKKG
jgi:hypothetical protein